MPVRDYLFALAALTCSALDSAYHRKQRELLQGHPKAHVAALLSLARQRFKVKYKLMTTDAIWSTARWASGSESSSAALRGSRRCNVEPDRHARCAGSR